MSDEEEWRPIVGLEKSHEINREGCIRSIKREKVDRLGRRFSYGGKICKSFKNVDGYIAITLHCDGCQKQIRVHRAIAEAFIPNPENKPQVNHINGIKDDNRIENLEWCTAMENVRHAHKIGLSSPPKGSEHFASAITEIDVIEIRRLRSTGVELKELSSMFGVSESVISNISNHRSWVHVPIVNYFLGIDPGQGSFLFVIGDGYHESYQIPTDKDGVNIKELALVFRRLPSIKHAVIEDVHSVFGASAKSNWNFGRTVGILEALLAANGIEYTKIQPKKWQKQMWDGVDVIKKENGSTDTKATSMLAAKKLFPSIDLRKSERAKKPDHNKVDALLIAEYCRRNYENKSLTENYTKE